MPAFVAPAIAAAAKLGPPALAAMKTFGSKHLLTLLLGGAFLGSTGLTEYGKAGERDLSREQIRLQKLLGESQAEATKLSVKEDRKRTKEYMDALLKAQRVEKREAREAALLQSFTQSQDRQMAMVMQAMQGISQVSRPSSAGGMVNMMRSNF